MPLIPSMSMEMKTLFGLDKIHQLGDWVRVYKTVTGLAGFLEEYWCAAVDACHGFGYDFTAFSALG